MNYKQSEIWKWFVTVFYMIYLVSLGVTRVFLWEWNGQHWYQAATENFHFHRNSWPPPGEWYKIPSCRYTSLTIYFPGAYLWHVGVLPRMFLNRCWSLLSMRNPRFCPHFHLWIPDQQYLPNINISYGYCDALFFCLVYFLLLNGGCMTLTMLLVF